MAHTDTIMNRLPNIVKRKDTMEDYVAAHDLEFGALEDDIEDIIDSKMVDTATGSDLDRIGALFGELGKRRGRDDSDYRAYLKGVVQSFNGRGTTAGLKFAIASAIGTTTDNVEIREDFQTLSYAVTVQNVPTSFVSSAIIDLADLADPSVVELDETTLIVTGDDVIIFEDPAITTNVFGLGTPILDLDGTETLG